jgi:hypothetical protein
MGFLQGDSETSSTVLQLVGLSEYVQGERQIANGWLTAKSAQDAYSSSATRAAGASNLLGASAAKGGTAAQVLGRTFAQAGVSARRAGSDFMYGQKAAARAVAAIEKPAYFRVIGIDKAHADLKRLAAYASRQSFNFQGRKVAPVGQGKPENYQGQVVALNRAARRQGRADRFGGDLSDQADRQGYGDALPRLRRAKSLGNLQETRPFDFGQQLTPPKRQRPDFETRMQRADDALARRDTLREARHARQTARPSQTQLTDLQPAKINLPQPRFIAPKTALQSIVIPSPKVLGPRLSAQRIVVPAPQVIAPHLSAQRIIVPSPRFILPQTVPQRIVVPAPKIAMPQYGALQRSQFTGQVIRWRPKTAPIFDPLAPQNMTPARLLNPGSAPQIPQPRKGQTIFDYIKIVGADAYADAQNRLGKNWDSVKSHLGAFLSDSDKVGRLANTMGAGLGIVAGAAGWLGKEMLTSAGSVESNLKALEALTGSAEKAKAIFATMDAASTSSVFERKDILVAGRLLTAYGMDVKRFLPLSDDLAAAFKDQGVTIADTARVMGRLKSGDFGEAFERLRDFGISRKELEGKGLVFDNGGSYKGSVEQAMAAVESIIKKRFSGLSKTLATETFEGAASNFSDALDRLKATGGDVILPSATEAIKNLTTLVSETNEFVKLHPRILQNAAAFGKYALAAGLAAAAGLKVLETYLRVRDVISKTTGAKNALTIATKGDTLAEKVKAGVALEESAAIGGVGKAAAETATKLGLLARVKGLASGARAFAGAPLMLGGGYIPTIASSMPGMRTGGGPMSRGGAAFGVALGIGAGVGIYNDRKVLGHKDDGGQEKLYAGIVGAVTAGAAAFYPPARLFID